MDKTEVAHILQDIGLFLELKGENPFKFRAYYNGARIIELLPEELGKLVQEKRLKEITGIGDALAAKIAELWQTGRLKYYEELKASIPPGLFEILRLPGFGPKKAGMLYEQLGITNLRELEYACRENRLVDLQGFGAKTQEKALLGIEYLKTFQGQFYFAEAIQHGQRLLDTLRQCPAVVQAEVAGSLRRLNEVVGDIDLVVCGEHKAEISRYFTRLPEVAVIQEEGESQARVKLTAGIQADLQIVHPGEYPFALHYFTGSKEHNKTLREMAGKKGYILNAYGLWKDGTSLACADEEELFLFFDLPYIPPELRENKGEFTAAQKGILPTLVGMADIKGIFHVHTNYSDGDDTLEAMVQEALRLGYAYIGISDHSQTAYYARGLKPPELERQFREIAELRVKYPQIEILSGIESDIKADGSLDYPEELLSRFDFVIASVHSHFRMGEEEMTSRMVKAMSHPRVTMLGHPTGRILLARQGYALAMEQILATAKEQGVIIELNASPARLDIDWRLLKKAKEMGIFISINPDAHRREDLGDVAYGVAVARKGWLEREDVFNCRDLRQVKEYLQSRKR